MAVILSSDDINELKAKIKELDRENSKLSTKVLSRKKFLCNLIPIYFQFNFTKKELEELKESTDEKIEDMEKTNTGLRNSVSQAQGKVEELEGSYLKVLEDKRRLEMRVEFAEKQMEDTYEREKMLSIQTVHILKYLKLKLN